MIAANVGQYPVGLMCRVLKVSYAGYWCWRRDPVGKRERANKRQLALISEVFLESGRTYGSPRIYEELKKRGVENVVYIGFMTHMCVNSTTRASFNHGYANTVVAGATATRAIPNPATGAEVPAAQLQDASLSALGDMFAVVVPKGTDVPD